MKSTTFNPPARGVAAQRSLGKSQPRFTGNTIIEMRISGDAMKCVRALAIAQLTEIAVVIRAALADAWVREFGYHSDALNKPGEIFGLLETPETSNREGGAE
jgi:hypothetical protein